jgi:lactate permease
MDQEVRIVNILGLEGMDYSLKWAYLPGTVPFMLVVLFSVFIFRMKKQKVIMACKNSFQQISGAAVALIAGVALVQIMLNTGNGSEGSMITEMAALVANISGRAYPVFATLLGMLGSFISGSATVSNILFSSFQFEVAQVIKMPEVLIMSMQCIGAAVGNMICINNVIAVMATVGCVGVGGKIIRINAIPAFLYYLVVTFIIMGFIFLG